MHEKVCEYVKEKQAFSKPYLLSFWMVLAFILDGATLLCYDINVALAMLYM